MLVSVGTLFWIYRLNSVAHSFQSISQRKLIRTFFSSVLPNNVRKTKMLLADLKKKMFGLK